MDTPHSFEQLYREAIPSVVSIYVTPAEGGDGRRAGAGSGFVYDAGHVVTNHHVVGAATDVELRFSDGEWTTGSVVGRDAHTDLAVVHADDLPTDAEPLAIATDSPSSGRPVAALGNPMGLDGTITTGVVSGVSRSTPTGNGFTIPDTVQTDAAINPGNSGGPLLTLDGEVVGVNRAKQGDNIGFAISASIVRRVVPELISAGTFDHSYLRIRTIDVSPTIAEANGLEESRGVLVVDAPDGPLRGSDATRRARGREIPVGGDVIVGIDGSEIRSHEELQRYLIVETRPGEELAIELIRDGERVVERAMLEKRPDTGAVGRSRSQRHDGRRIPIE
ncbi:S1C family serine protease [Halalkalicoccus salilacus]|uniref:S1C family serine protease n=1 Tax=Halalkalicoccus TaxID=332246 RepID=UPI002F96A7C8